MLKRTHTFTAKVNTQHIIELEDEEWLDKATYHTRTEGKLEILCEIKDGFRNYVYVTNKDIKQNHKVTLWIHRPKPDRWDSF